MHGPTEFFDIHNHHLAEKTAAAAAVICISDFARSQLMALIPFTHWNKLRVVHCGVDPNQFQTPRSMEASRTRQATRLLCVARLVPVKGHAILLQALADLLVRGFPFYLTLIGDGPARPDLERLADLLGIAPSVHFAGNIGQDQIAAHFVRADLFILPSFAEGVPVVLMEAMASRCPVIATRIAGIAELIDDGRSGVLVPPGRADLLAQAIERLVLDPVLRNRLADHGCEKVQRDFNLHKVAHQLADAFERRLPSGPSPAKRVPATRPANQVPALAQTAPTSGGAA
jgi:glycosyltransferase involved in cell wall biosynthesis